MPVIFEFGEWIDITGKRNSLENYLHQVWLQNKPIDEELAIFDANFNDGGKPEVSQGFLLFDGEETRARNYIGFIQTDDFFLEIYPKVFRMIEPTPANTRLFMKHMFFWFDYCRKWKFPFTRVNLENNECDSLPELIINLMAAQIQSTVETYPLMLYIGLEESLTVPRGRINFDRYINNGFVTANQHILECDHEPLVFDNQLNRIIKYVSRQLLKKTKFNDSRRKLEQILFILDDVSDEGFVSGAMLDRIKLNSFFEEYQSVINICRLVLNDETYSNHYEEQHNWSLLFPMEYIFEDFIAGFIETELSAHWIVNYQKSDMYLTEKPNQAFQMQHDIFLTSKKDKSIKVILDTKYKLRATIDDDKKQGVAQSDMYQMVSYGLRRGCTNVVLLYPNFMETCRNPHTYVVASGFDQQHQIKITAAEIPFWSTADFSGLRTALSKALQTILPTPNYPPISIINY